MALAQDGTGLAVETSNLVVNNQQNTSEVVVKLTALAKEGISILDEQLMIQTTIVTKNTQDIANLQKTVNILVKSILYTKIKNKAFQNVNDIV
jgi:uncharacterized ion transporter superfamily protein YfcC